MNMHTVTRADGTTSTRNSANRVYTHAVLSISTPSFIQWCGSEVLAQKAMRSRCSYPKWHTGPRKTVEERITEYGVYIVEVTLLKK